jgi:tryptophan halogenase
LRNESERIRKIVIAGGGTAGWVAATALSHQFRDLVDITLVESEQIGTVGVGESTIPTIRTFHQLLQIDEQEFLKEVAGSFKLSISFENWLHQCDRYIHPFGFTGLGIWACEFHHFWLDSLRRGMQSELGDFCLETVASRTDQFALIARNNDPSNEWSVKWAKTPPALDRPEINYAYHFDAALYAVFLRRMAEKRGITRLEGKIREVRQDSGRAASLRSRRRAPDSSPRPRRLRPRRARRFRR